MKNITPIYLPRPARITRIIAENSQIKTFVLAFTDTEYNYMFSYAPGQFMMVSVPHCGEAPISFSSSPKHPGTIQLSVRKAGGLTGVLHEMKEGAIIGLRGPYGNGFPMIELAHRDLFFVAGGIGLAPLRGVIETCLTERERYGRITLLYGSRLPSDIAFRSDIESWQRLPETHCLLTVDRAEPGWNGQVGLVSTLLDQAGIDPARQTALLCGPPLMIRVVIDELSRRGFADERLIITMERHMKCGVGVCRHCHMDGKLVCVDGPVFSLAQLKQLTVMELA